MLVEEAAMARSPWWAVILAMSAFLRSPVAAQGPLQGPFADVPAGHWAAGAVEELSALGAFIGYADGRFDGSRPMTRYEAAVAMHRPIFYSYQAMPAAGSPPRLFAHLPAAGPPITDVPEEHWSEYAIRELHEGCRW